MTLRDSRQLKYQRKWGLGGRARLTGQSSLARAEVRPELRGFCQLVLPSRKAAPFSLETVSESENCPTHIFVCLLCRARGYAGPAFLLLLSPHSINRGDLTFCRLCVACVCEYKYS